MNFTQIRALYMVVSEGSLAAAAQAIGVSQPTLSQHLQALEATSETRLFEKRGRRLALTEAGQRLFQAAEKVMAASQQVDDLMTRRGALTEGKITLISDTPALAVEVLARFRARHPEIELNLRIASVRQVLGEVREGSADAGIATDTPVGSDLVLRPLWRERLWVSLPLDHPLSAKSTLDRSDLQTETLLLREPGSRTRARVLNIVHGGETPALRAIEIGDRTAIREGVARGLGLSVQSQSECAPDPRLAHRPFQDPSARSDFVENLVLRRNYRRAPELAAFVDLALEEAAGIDAALDAPGAAPWIFSAKTGGGP